MFQLNFLFLLFMCVFGIDLPFYDKLQNMNIYCPMNNSKEQKLNKITTALILARGGSKGINLKNIAMINGTTLLGRTINSIQSSNVFRHIWVSTDNDQIASEAKKYEGVRIHHRNTYTALDETPSIFAVQEFVDAHPYIKNIALIQCTSVFLKPKYLIAASETFNSCDCVFAVTRSYKLRWKFNQKAKNIQPLNFDPLNRPRRQDWDGELLETGMFYFSTRELIMNGTFQNSRCKFVAVGQKDSLEIDNLIDLKFAQFLIENNYNS